MKYIIITGGVLSGLGKGITTSSIGRLLISRGFKVTAIKIDPYLNCDAGTMNPYQHGEVFVLEDGSEVDLDLGNYERFLEVNLTSTHNITTGKIYRAVIEKERKGLYLGETVQIIPHITNQIKEELKKVASASKADIVLVELGGTVGDIESMPFLEAVRQLHREVGGEENCVFVHTTLVPVVGPVDEQKSKPTQHSVRELRALGIQPDLIVGRAKKELDYEVKRKISLFCDVPLEAVVSVADTKTIYRIPMELENQHLTDYLLKKLGLQERKKDLEEWERFTNRILNPDSEIELAIVGKYVHLKDSYISYIESLNHCSAQTGIKSNIKWIEAEELEKGETALLEGVHGIIIPGGFGERGSEGKTIAIKYAREKKIPFLGVCFGFQLAVVEYARNVLGLKDANSTEFKKTSHPVIDILPSQRKVKELGGTMRLGSHPIIIKKRSLAYSLYKKTKIYERHRHRYEVNPKYIEKLENAGLNFTGKSQDRKRMEILELKEHPYFIASQFHPEFKSRLTAPAPLFLGLVKAAKEFKITS
ncbi:MAG: CTP synthase (glutamine hydrolyzing) [Candidatus Thermoplasmatota archaeon]|nr:CTP synthase (glutamine hydrolyzing) [Candidatus Thermoplasmatota archaeon]